MDKISTPWVTVCLAQLLLQCVITKESHTDKDTAGHETMDRDLEMKNNVHVGPFRTEILKGRVAQAPAKDTHVMVLPIRRTEGVQGKECLLPRTTITPCSQLEVSKFR